MTLRLRLLGDGVAFVVDNPGPDPVRIWDRASSWGRPTLELELGPPGDGATHLLTPTPQRWTRNFPRAVEIPPGGRHEVVVAAGAEPEWDGLERARPLLDGRLRVRGRLRIPPSPEAAEQGVFVGELTSPWVDSEPPHAWLGTGA